jgi:hypothetical protein
MQHPADVKPGDADSEGYQPLEGYQPFTRRQIATTSSGPSVT